MTYFHRFALPALAAAMLAAPALGEDQTAPRSTPQDLVNALNGVFGEHKARAVHAKGILLQGVFTPSKAAASISRAPQFQGSAIPIVARFSNFAGIPDVPDNAGPANPRGLALKFRLPDGTESDIVSHSFNGFPSATADDFRQFLTALATSGADAPKPTPLDKYLDTHPRAKTFATAPKPAPVSYATLPYFGVNAFKFTNAKGQETYGRYQFIPMAGDHFLTDAEATKKGPNYLMDEIATRIRQQPVKFHMVLQIADKGDKTDDPSITWPASRRTVDLGVISITRVIADNENAQRQILFMPNRVPAGIEAADPMIAARSSAYPLSFSHRQ